MDVGVALGRGVGVTAGVGVAAGRSGVAAAASSVAVVMGVLVAVGVACPLLRQPSSSGSINRLSRSRATRGQRVISDRARDMVDSPRNASPQETGIGMFLITDS